MKQERAIQTRARVLEAAARAFNEHGYLGATMDQIVKLAGVTKGALYFHFDSKEELARAVAERSADGGLLIERLLSEEQPALQILMGIGVAWADHIKNDEMTRAAIRLSMEYGAYERPMPQLYDDWLMLTQALLKQAQDEGDVRPDLDTVRAAHLMVASFVGVQVVSQVYTGYEDFTVRIEELWRQLLFPALLRPERISEYTN